MKEGNPEDAASLYSFNDQVTLLNSFTRRLTRLEDSLRPLKADAGTSLYDAIYLSTSALRDRDGRHVVVVVTDGGDTTSTKKYSDALSSHTASRRGLLSHCDRAHHQPGRTQYRRRACA